MIMLEKKIGFTRDEVHWIDRENDRFFRRVVGGLAWPSANPGFMVIVAEEDKEDDLIHEHHFFVVNEIEERDMTDFIRRCSELRRVYGLENIYGNPSNKVAQEMLSQFNENLPDKGHNGLYVEKAPFVDEQRGFEFCTQIIRKHLNPARKSLHLGTDSRLPAVLAGGPDTIMLSKPDEFPAIAALGYAVGALDVWKPFKQRPADMQQSQYDVFTLYAR